MAEKKAQVIQWNDKKWLHWSYNFNVPVECVCGNQFTINTTVQWPLRIETCYDCHPIYNKDKVIKKVVKWRMEKFIEKQKKIDKLK